MSAVLPSALRNGSAQHWPTNFPFTAMSEAARASGKSAEVLLVDASVYVFRAWHSMPDEWVDQDGWPVNAVHGFVRFLLELLERQSRNR